MLYIVRRPLSVCELRVSMTETNNADSFQVLEMGKPDEGVTSRMNRWCSASARRDFFEQRLQPCLAELLGTAVFVCVGCVSGVRSVGVADGIQSALAHGLALGVLILIFGPISGGHFNPAVSVSAYLCGGLELRLLPAYILAQLFGGVVGAGLAKAVSPPDLYTTSIGGAIRVDPSALIALTVAEVILTSFLTSVVCMGAINSQTRSILAPFGIGLTVTAGAICGACMNPARAFGPAIIAGHWDKHWVYWIGPVCGALITAFHIRFLFGDRETRIVSK